jgi:hypothetical protein
MACAFFYLMIMQTDPNYKTYILQNNVPVQITNQIISNENNSLPQLVATKNDLSQVSGYTFMSTSICSG